MNVESTHKDINEIFFNLLNPILLNLFYYPLYCMILGCHGDDITFDMESYYFYITDFNVCSRNKF